MFFGSPEHLTFLRYEVLSPCPPATICKKPHPFNALLDTGPHPPPPPPPKQSTSNPTSSTTTTIIITVESNIMTFMDNFIFPNIARKGVFIDQIEQINFSFAMWIKWINSYFSMRAKESQTNSWWKKIPHQRGFNKFCLVLQCRSISVLLFIIINTCFNWCKSYPMYVLSINTGK